MSPLQAPPSFGYIDGQRVENWDGPTLQNVSAGPATVFNSGVLDVSRYARVAGRIIPNAGLANVFFTWYLDQAGTLQVAQREFTVDGTAGGQMQYHFSNHGPFVRISAGAPDGATNFQFTLVAFASNRESVTEVTPTVQTLIDRQGAAINNGATDVNLPASYYAGPVNMWVDVGGAGRWLVGFSYLNTLGNYDTFDGIDTTVGAAFTQIHFQTVVPLSIWRCSVVNFTGANSTYSLAVMASSTGST